MTGLQPPRAIWSATMRRILADGGWHDRAEVLAAGARAVPPSIAWRRAEKHRLSAKVPHAESPDRMRGDDHDAIAAGQRRIANDALRRLEKMGAVERDGERIRFPPAGLHMTRARMRG
jgi:hypothetical protein